MAIMPKTKTDDHEENVFWTTMSDLMLGLAVVCMTLFVLAISGFSEQVLEQKQQQVKASNEIVEKLKEQNIEAEIDKMTGDIKISDLELFEVNSWVLSKKGQQYLDKLISIYRDTIFSKPELLVGIDNIVVQGHTDSQSFSGLFQCPVSRRQQRAEYDSAFRLNFQYTYRHPPVFIIFRLAAARLPSDRSLRTESDSGCSRSRRIRRNCRIRSLRNHSLRSRIRRSRSLRSRSLRSRNGCNVRNVRSVRSFRTYTFLPSSSQRS